MASPALEPTTRLPAEKASPRRSIHDIYSRPAPVKVFPLPTFQPSNPLSVAQLLYSWVSQVLFPPKEAFEIYQGLFSPHSMSVNIINEKEMFALWQQGFYGKGNLSRSEPNWAKSQEVKKGLKDAHVSESFTILRREQRKEAKWERARAEQAAINATRLREALENFDQSLVPHSPLSLLTLPNSLEDMVAKRKALERVVIDSQNDHLKSFGLSVSFNAEEADRRVENSSPLLEEAIPESLAIKTSSVPFSPLALLALPNSQAELEARKEAQKLVTAVEIPSPPVSVKSEQESNGNLPKTVRFSPDVESAVYFEDAPPSPQTASDDSQTCIVSVKPETLKQEHTVDVGVETLATAEHLQLTFEEAFFLAYGLGCLEISNPESKKAYSNTELFRLFREHSHVPPRIAAPLRSDDPFLVNYVVYHHFRSLGFVPRPGMKFGVDWLLYQRGPVFDHAEYGMVLIPSYSSPEWAKLGVSMPERNWQWFHGVNRTLAHAFKTFVVVYVDIPSLSEFAFAEKKGGITAVLKLYKVREFIIKRWSANRNR
ncbi:tRNA splicing endonuclease subunit sen2 [Ceratocystis pirilliformis]|uniref:tRNA-intron lyase n=1 Tax=Ceratocystis pirilliformis TaxID=259994 RepID=A0ABR3YXC0_9PEZI